MALLEARIAAGERYAYSVAFSAPSGLPEGECFRFALHYYARVLYELARSESSVRGLPQWIERIASTEVDPDADLFALAGVPGSLAHALPAAIAEVAVELRTWGLRDRELAGDLFPLRGTTLAVSVIAVVQAVLAQLSEPLLALLPSALANMNASYELTHPYTDPVGVREVPALAFRAASFVS